MHLTLQELEELYRATFARLQPDREPPPVNVVFYPYVNVNHTIRVRNGKVVVRISTMLKASPENVHQALALILVSKLLKKKVPSSADRVYGEFTADPGFRSRALAHKKEKGRKVLSGAEGEAYDLREIFDTLNSDYFGGDLPRPALSWSGTKTFRRLGHYDEAHNAIVVSKSLDSRSIPAFVVEFVVYHEMLHIKHPTIHRNGRRYSHTPAFRRDEMKYDYFDEAEAWIERNFDELKRIAGKDPKRRPRRRYWGLFD